ncbi:MAG: hypothetical protein FJW39_26305 [Acidobacteria bacterium]|nr:hypothetical protein [Acidobacteriota bacterium]
MELLPLFQWFEATFIGTKVRESLWMFPVIECVHLLALALLGGTILAVDLRRLGLGLKEQNAADLNRQLHPWMSGSVAMLILTGIPMFLSEAVKCYYSPPFWYKMGLLAVAYTFTLRRRAESRPAAVVSLGLWFSVAFAGRWIAFY